MGRNAAKRIWAVVFALVLILGTGMQAVAAPVDPANDSEADIEVTDILLSLNEFRARYGAGNEYGAFNYETRGIPSNWNTFPAGLYFSGSKMENLSNAIAAFRAEYNSVYSWTSGNDPTSAYVLGNEFNAVKSAQEAFIADLHESDGSLLRSSNQSKGGGSSSPSVGKTPETNHGIFQNTSIQKIDAALKELNKAIASGDTAKADAIRNRGVTIETSVWHSFNKKVYQQIENSNIPVTLKFLYKGVKYSVTIPAGAKVTELCDKNGWCGFLNLAAHYGAIVLEK